MQTQAFKRHLILILLSVIIAQPNLAQAQLEILFFPVYALVPNTLLFPMDSKNVTNWKYLPSANANRALPTDISINIERFEDRREEKLSDLIFIADIPLIPYGSISSSKPEQASKHLIHKKWIFNPSHDFTGALLEELEAAKVFKEVSLDKKGNSDLVIKGEILNTAYRGKVYSYGLSAVGKVLWLIGFPMLSYSENLSLRITCIDILTNRVLVSKTYTPSEEWRVEWVYSVHFHQQEMLYPKLMKSIYNEFAEDLKAALKEERQTIPDAKAVDTP